jgi:hypothetical protein
MMQTEFSEYRRRFWIRALACGVALALAGLLGCTQSSDLFVLTRGELSPALQFEVPAESEVLLHLRMTSDTDWSERGREAAVVTLFLDGQESERNQDVVLFRGEQPFVYKLALGRLSAGEHSLRFAFNEQLSAPKASTVHIQDAQFRFITPDSADFDVYRYSPVLYGRDDNATTDTPLLMYHEVLNSRQGKKIEYTVIWSNEDGGTNSIGLMSRWGRTTDIELIYRVAFDSAGRVVREEYQSAGHDTLEFRGQRIADHPVLRTASLNNGMSDSGRSRLKFFLSPERRKEKAFSREIIMDRDPWTYEVMAKEMRREGKYEDPGDPATVEVSDARNYLYVEFDSEMTGTSPRLTFGVRLRGDDTWYRSDHGIDTVQAVNRSGWRRTTIELPPGTRLSDLDQLEVHGAAEGTFEIRLKRISRLFLLAEDFSLREYPLVWKQVIVLTRRRPSVVLPLTALGTPSAVARLPFLEPQAGVSILPFEIDQQKALHCSIQVGS